jgi:hypothetical protein
MGTLGDAHRAYRFLDALVELRHRTVVFLQPFHVLA